MNIIVAIADNNAIGKNNQLLWHISEDLRYFKKVTMGATVIMGRKTYESIGKPLPGRRNIVISRTLEQIPGIEVFASVEAVIEELKSANNEAFVIGGGELYKSMLPYTKKLYLTFVHTTIPDADTFFPEIDYSQWREVSRETFLRGEKFEHPFEFVVFENNGVSHHF